MQFELAIFAAYDLPVPLGGVPPPSPYDPVDALYAAARDLCANSWHYVDEVITTAEELGQRYRRTLMLGGLPTGSTAGGHRRC